MSTTIDKADQIARRRARVLPFFAVLLLAQQTVFWAADGRAVGTTKTIAWAIMVLVMLLLLTTGGALMMPREVRELADDEVTRANRAVSIQRGFIAAVLTAMLVFLLSPFEPISAQHAAHLIISLGLGIALLSFGLLERKSLD